MSHERAELLIKKDTSFESQYDVLHELGRGRFAVVKKCVCKATGKAFAAKVIKKSRTGNQGRSGREQLLLEIDILNQSQHPKLVRLFNVYETRTEMQLILELAAGGDLHHHCIEADVIRTEKEICYLIHQIAEAVKYLHDNKIVHLDLKPDNILLKKSGEIFPEIALIDFGLSRRLDLPYSQFDIVGTPEYVAPEVLAYEPIDYGSDMWSIGVVTYVLLSGISPFAGEDVMETYANIGMVDYDFDCEEFDDISDAAMNFIERLLERSPKKRMKAHEALEHEWLKQLAQGITAEDVVEAQNLQTNQRSRSSDESESETETKSSRVFDSDDDEAEKSKAQIESETKIEDLANDNKAEKVKEIPIKKEEYVSNKESDKVKDVPIEQTEKKDIANEKAEKVAEIPKETTAKDVVIDKAEKTVEKSKEPVKDLSENRFVEKNEKPCNKELPKIENVKIDEMPVGILPNDNKNTDKHALPPKKSEKPFPGKKAEIQTDRHDKKVDEKSTSDKVADNKATAVSSANGEKKVEASSEKPHESQTAENHSADSKRGSIDKTSKGSTKEKKFSLLEQKKQALEENKGQVFKHNDKSFKGAKTDISKLTSRFSNNNASSEPAKKSSSTLSPRGRVDASKFQSKSTENVAARQNISATRSTSDVGLISKTKQTDTAGKPPSASSSKSGSPGDSPAASRSGSQMSSPATSRTQSPVMRSESPRNIVQRKDSPSSRAECLVLRTTSPSNNSPSAPSSAPQSPRSSTTKLTDIGKVEITPARSKSLKATTENVDSTTRSKSLKDSTEKKASPSWVKKTSSTPGSIAEKMAKFKQADSPKSTPPTASPGRLSNKFTKESKPAPVKATKPSVPEAKPTAVIADVPPVSTSEQKHDDNSAEPTKEVPHVPAVTQDIEGSKDAPDQPNENTTMKVQLPVEVKTEESNESNNGVVAETKADREDSKMKPEESKAAEAEEEMNTKQEETTPVQKKEPIKMTLGGSGSRKLVIGPLVPSNKDSSNGMTMKIGAPLQMKLNMEKGVGDQVDGKPSKLDDSDERERAPMLKDMKEKSKSVTRRRGGDEKKTYRRLYVAKARNSRTFEANFNMDNEAAKIMQRVDNDVLKIEFHLKSTDLKLLP